MSEEPSEYSLSAYNYELPQELIAQQPCEPRDHSRLLVIDRQKESFEEIRFADLASLLQSGDQLVLNDTKVIPARLVGKRATGGKVEILLSKQLTTDTWEVLARPAKKLDVGSELIFGETLRAWVVAEKEEGVRCVRFVFDGPFYEVLAEHGQIPLPKYIRGGCSSPDDLERYQTKYASNPGAVAAPTAGLHFTERMLQQLAADQVEISKLTLHVGLGTFRPVQVEDIREHRMHEEYYSVSAQTALELNRNRFAKKAGRQICVGTTTCRVLESVASEEGMIHSGEGYTRIFIYPGYRFKFVKSLLTNFHLPGSTLLMLVCALGGYELMMEAYAKAVKDRFRFFSYGDAMLII